MKPNSSVSGDSYADFQRHTAAFLDEHRQHEVLIIAASHGAADDALWIAGSDGSFGVRRFTLSQAAAVLVAGTLAQQGLKLADRFAAEAVAARAAYELRRQQGWTYFAPVADMPGFPQALARTLTELRMNGITPAQCRAGGAPGVDLAAALQLYREQLAAFALADVADLHELALEVIKSGAHWLLGLPMLILDAAVRTELARTLVAALISRSPAAMACTLSHDRESCAFYDEVMEHKPKAASPHEENTLARVRRWLFSTEPPQRADFDDTIDYFSAPGEAMECVEIARRILRLAARNVSFDHIAVLLRSPERYQPLLEEAFRRAGIPAYFSRGVVRPDPAGRAFLALLTCALENCSASRFAEYVSLGQVPSPGEAAADPVAVEDEIHAALRGANGEPAEKPANAPDEAADDTSPVIEGTLQAPAQWEHLLVDAAVVGGADRWERRLNALGNELRLKLDRSAGQPSDQAYYEAELQRLGNLQAFALPLIQRLSSLPAVARWGEWLDVLRDLARGTLRRPGHVVAVLDELQAMADIGPVPLEEVTLVLSDRLRFLRREPEGRRYGRVFVGGIEEARGRAFDVVFTPGLAEGVFPQRVAEDPLLLDDNRQRISEALLTNRRRSQHERLLLGIAVAAASRRFVFSWPRIDLGQSRPRVPSFYALEAIRAGHGFLPPDLRRFLEEASDRAPSRLDRPAPREFADAIDNTEYDLVALDRALTAKVSERQGAMGYLTKVSEPLGRSLRARYSRWEMKKWTAHDGLLNTDSTLGDTLPAYRLAARPYSPTSLQAFAACPYRFVLLGMHGLRPRDTIQPLNQMDPLTRGGIFHAIQHEFFERAQAAGLLPVTAANLSACRETLDLALSVTAEKYADELAPAIQRVWRAELEDIRTDLHGWLQNISVEAAWIPAHFELAFGLRDTDGRDPSSIADPVTLANGTRLRGAIDLVERHVTRGTLRVVDHKTGKPPDRPPSVVGAGTALQPLLYTLAAEKALGAPVESGRLFYCTQRGNYRAIDIPATPDARLRMERVLAIIDNAIVAGTLPAAPARDACKTCDCRSVCGPHEELRWHRKIRALDELDELRSMP